MLTQLQKQKYIQGWQKRKKNKTEKLQKKKKIAIKKAEKISLELRTKYEITKVILFGSLVENKFWQHSDIDIAINNLKDDMYLKVFGEMSEIASPFKLDLVLIENAPESLVKKIKNKGVEI